jgi:hypothetical protein
VPPALHGIAGLRYRRARGRAAPSPLPADRLASGTVDPGFRRDDEKGAAARATQARDVPMP